MALSGGDFAALEKLLHKKPPAAPGERCDFCAVPIAPDHGHLIDLKARRIMCGCRPCWLVFEPQGAAQGRYKPIPRRYAKIDDLPLDGAAWDALQIPIGLAFFFYNSVEGKLCAFYPGPAGATESQLPLGEWDATIAAHPVLSTMAPDVEAILIDRSSHSRSSSSASGSSSSSTSAKSSATSSSSGTSYPSESSSSLGSSQMFLVPIDAAYELVGIIRSSWKGFDGGEVAWRRIKAFLATLDERCIDATVGSGR